MSKYINSQIKNILFKVCKKCTNSTSNICCKGRPWLHAVWGSLICMICNITLTMATYLCFSFKVRVSQINLLMVDAQRDCLQIFCLKLQMLQTAIIRKWGPLWHECRCLGETHLPLWSTRQQLNKNLQRTMRTLLNSLSVPFITSQHHSKTG